MKKIIITLAACMLLHGCDLSHTDSDDITHIITYTASPDNATDTISIDFVFSAPVSDLEDDDITVEDWTGVVTRGALTGSGRYWSLAVDVERSGNVRVSVDRYGIESGSVTVAVNIPLVRTVSVSGHVLAIGKDGSLWAWGNNLFGQLGIGAGGTERVDTPHRVGTDNDWAYAVTGMAHTVAIRTDGSLWAWGGVTTTSPNIPVRIGMDNDWALVSSGGRHTVAIKTDGSLWAWGNNTRGQLGDGTTTSRNTPIRIGMDSDWAWAFAGPNRTIAIRTDGSLWAWGDNRHGQLGDGTGGRGDYGYRNTPIRIGPSNDWAFASIGGCSGQSGHTIAVKTDGSLWAWGHNEMGQLGDGAGRYWGTPPGTGISEGFFRDSPIRIGTDNDWASVSASTDFTMAIRTDGTLWAWGVAWSVVYDRPTTQFHTNNPTQIGTDTDWATLSAFATGWAVRTDGSVWSWEPRANEPGGGIFTKRMP
ncbi:MAG: hypothetical protein FWB78_03100 [Treponema sp.]|nr:hypothetical protein [Treponema sp.]